MFQKIEIFYDNKKFTLFTKKSVKNLRIKNFHGNQNQFKRYL